MAPGRQRGSSRSAAGATASTSSRSTPRPATVDRRRRGRLLGRARTGRPTARSSRPTRTRPRPPSSGSSRDGRAPGDAARAGATRRPRRAARAPRGRHVHVVRRRRDPGVPLPAGGRVGRATGARGRLPARRPDELLRRRVGRARPVLRRQGLRVARDQLPRLDGLRAATSSGSNHGDWGVRRHEGLPRGRRLPPHARLGRRRAARHLRRELRLVHGAARRHRRPRAPLPLRGREVRRLRHPHLVGAGRPGRACRTWGG